MAGTLLEAGADVAARDEGGSTPLHYASFGGFAVVARMLLAAGADVAVNLNHPMDEKNTLSRQPMMKTQLVASSDDSSVSFRCGTVLVLG